jgi:hypothetical protein
MYMGTMWVIAPMATPATALPPNKWPEQVWIMFTLAIDHNHYPSQQRVVLGSRHTRRRGSRLKGASEQEKHDMEHDAAFPPVLVAEGSVDEGAQPSAEEEGRDEPALGR